ncbi:hypothetical protein Pcinc_019657 [Petrolisthes cinctipes]|uniref:Connector enhancer of kinase suppressor of ras 2-like n=1 Tax=Petrolisthes cinctipes TaxID=88211 RepID=A0AAE1FKT4_PETCI|nr:hypothetical protein Pcinc_019657 [Petrolisthes cinctipes]
MAYVNVAEWSPDQVAEWLKGLDETVLPYVHYFVNNRVDGRRLLQLSPDDLPPLCVTKVGHQELILQAVELLRNIHYQLDQENVQYLALRLSSKARSIYCELRQTPQTFVRNGAGSAEEDNGNEDGEGAERRAAQKRQERVSTAVIAGVAEVLAAVKGLVCWLNRQPFEGQERYNALKSSLVELSIRLATIAQRDMFAENQATVILQLCRSLAMISDKIIQEYDDPLIIQPASLDIATVKKKADDEWGLVLQSSYQGVHQVSGVIALSPAYQCGKLQEGDELVQIDYQTVVGWSLHKVTGMMQEFPVEVILTIKKRPRHTNTVNQMYLKPMRLPSKKRTYSPWGFSLTASPARYEIPSIPSLHISVSVDKVPIRRGANAEPHPKSSTPPPQLATPSPQPPSSVSDGQSTTSERESDRSESEDSEDDDAFLSDGELPGSSVALSARLYHPKPRAPVQRRATIPGATTRHTLSINQLLQDMRWNREGRGGHPEGSDPDLLRGPPSSERRQARPHTCIGTEDKAGLGKDTRRKPLLRAGVEKVQEEDGEVDAGGEGEEDKVGGECGGEKKVVNIIPLPPRKPTNHTSSSSSHRSPQAENKTSGSNFLSPPSHLPPLSPNKGGGANQEAVGPEGGVSRQRRVSEDRPKLDKSHSTPAYDMEEEQAATPSSAPPSAPADRTRSVKSPPSSGKPNSSPQPSLSNTKSNSTGPQNSSGPQHNSPSTQKTPDTTKQSPGITKQSPGSKHNPASTRQSPTSVKQSALIVKQVNITTTAVNTGGPHISAAATKAAIAPTGRLLTSKPRSIIHQASLPASSSPASPPAVSAHRSPGNIISSATTTIGDRAGRGQQFQTAVTFPVAAADGRSIGGGREEEGGEGSGRGGDGRGSEGSSSSGVVLRETRSSSPSVWRRGILLSDRGSRRISCRELGQGDHQGWLHRRRDNKGFLLPHRWERRWFILKKNYLYGYRDREAVRADSLIYLPGFDVSPATDVKAKKFAFKIYHSSGATFYFACDTSEERSRWMSQMGLSAITHQRHHNTSSTAPTTAHQHHIGSSTQHHNSTTTTITTSTTTSTTTTTTPTQQQQQGEEVYYSETDDELDDRPSPSSRSPQSSQSRTIPGKEGVASLWPGALASHGSRGAGRGSPLAMLGGTRGPGLRFLQPSRDTMNQPVPTASFRSYRRVGESSSRSTSTGDLRKELGTGPGEGVPGQRVTRKNSLRDRLRQLPTPFTLERKRQAGSRGSDLKQTKKSPNQQDHQKHQTRPRQEIPNLQQQHSHLEENIVTVPFGGTQLDSPGPTSPGPDSGFWMGEDAGGASRSRPHYMLPTWASSQHSPARPTSIDLDTRCSPSRMGSTKGSGTPPTSGRSSPSKFEVSGRRGSVGGESPLRSGSPRQGSLDCLAWSHPRALSPPISPLHTPTRSSHGSASSLLASEEYREGSPEKLWISSLRTDPTRPRPGLRSSPEKRDSRSRSGSGEVQLQERLKRAALYHPPLLRPRADIKAAFEMHLDPSNGVVVAASTSQDIQSNPPQTGSWEVSSTSSVVKRVDISSAAPRPEVPPRTKFLSPSERTLPNSSSSSSISPNSSAGLSGSSLSPSPSPSTMSMASSRSASSQSTYSGGQPSSRRLPNLTIRTSTDETEAIRTPLKPAMGVSMIGKQRRTPSVMSPRDVFFSSPPASPTVPFSPTLPTSPPIPSAGLSIASPSPLTLPSDTPPSVKLRSQKQILPHYPGMEYPPVFEPGSYSLCSSPADQPQSCSQVGSQPEGGYQDQGEVSSTHSNVETHVVFSVAQAAAAPQPHVHVTHTKLPVSSGEGVGIHNPGERGQPGHQSIPSREYKTQRNIEVGGNSGNHALHIIVAAHHNPSMMSVTSPSSSSSQNIYVSSPESYSRHSTTAIHHHNTTVSAGHLNTSIALQQQNTSSSLNNLSHRQQNLYVVSPARSTSYQNTYVTSPTPSSAPHIALTSRVVGRLTPEVTNGSAEPQHSSTSSSEGQSFQGEQPRRPSKSSIPPRLLLPAPPDTPPSDLEDEVITISTQTELPT